MLSPADQGALSFFYGEGASVLGGMSGMGQMLERAALYSTRGQKLVVDEITAWPAKAPRRESSFEPDDLRLHKFAKVARRMRLLAEINPLYVNVFEAYYGEIGDRFSRTKMGRHASLISMTASGRRLIAKSRAKSAGMAGLNEVLRFENDVLASSDVARKALVSKALTEAYELWDQACSAWNGEVTCSIAAE